jgi:putative membrane protein
LRALWIGIFLAVFTWSAIAPRDYFTWLLEVSPAVLGAIVLAATRSSYPLTSLTYVLVLLHCIVLMVGGHYTYAEVPLFNELGSSLGFERNNYDKLGHFAQGFVPAIIAREILVRNAVVSTAAWRNLFIVSFCLAFSAFYELIEWLVAVLVGQNSEAFLGTQGFEWDTQTDMAMALAGAVIALLTLSRLHDRQLETFTWNSRPS